MRHNRRLRSFGASSTRIFAAYLVLCIFVICLFLFSFVPSFLSVKKQHHTAPCLVFSSFSDGIHTHSAPGIRLLPRGCAPRQEHRGARAHPPAGGGESAKPALGRDVPCACGVAFMSFFKTSKMGRERTHGQRPVTAPSWSLPVGTRVAPGPLDLTHTTPPASPGAQHPSGRRAHARVSAPSLRDDGRSSDLRLVD